MCSQDETQDKNIYTIIQEVDEKMHYTKHKCISTRKCKVKCVHFTAVLIEISLLWDE